MTYCTLVQMRTVGAPALVENLISWHNKCEKFNKKFSEADPNSFFPPLLQTERRAGKYIGVFFLPVTEDSCGPAEIEEKDRRPQNFLKLLWTWPKSKNVQEKRRGHKDVLLLFSLLFLWLLKCYFMLFIWRTLIDFYCNFTLSTVRKVILGFLTC